MFKKFGLAIVGSKGKGGGRYGVAGPKEIIVS